MVVERLILEFQTDVATVDAEKGLPENRISRFHTLQEVASVLSADDGPCVVIRVDINRFAEQFLSTIDLGNPTASLSKTPPVGEMPTSQRSQPAKPYISRSGGSRQQSVREVLQSQAWHASSLEMANHLEQTLERLSPREWDVLILMLQAKTCKEMGSELHIGLPTVAKHRARVLKRFGVRDHIELFQLLNHLVSQNRRDRQQTMAS